MNLLQLTSSYSQELLIMGRCKSTVDNYSYAIRLFTKVVGNIELEGVNLYTMLEFRDYLEQNNYTSATSSTYCMCLRDMFKHYAELGLCSKDLVKMPIPRRIKKQPDYLKPHEIARIVDLEPCARNKTLIMLAFVTGARNAEIRHIKTVDYKGNAIKLRVTKTKVERTVYITREVKEYLDEYLKTRKQVSPYMFCSFRQPQLGSNTLNLIFKKAGERAGLKLYPHLLRHSNGRALLKSCQNMRLVQDYLGHANIQSTQIYTSVSSDELEIAHFKAFGLNQKRPLKV